MSSPRVLRTVAISPPAITMAWNSLIRSADEQW
jgi:hypothetical protein